MLLDHNLVRRLKNYLAKYETATTQERNWADVLKGELLALAEENGFDVLLAADENIKTQQNLANRKIAILILRAQQIDTNLDSDSGNAAQDFFNDRLSFNGFEVSGVYNVSRYVGVKGDFSGAYRTKEFSFPTGSGTTANNVSLRTKNSLYNVLGGVQFQDNASDSRVKPFAHVLAGVGHARSNVSNVICSNPSAANCSTFTGSFSDTGLAGAFGGGLDIKLSDKIDLRAVQVDYNPIRISGSTDHNVRFGIGLVFK